MKKTFVISALALLILGIAVQADVFKMGTGLTSLETVVVGDPGNKADDTGFGAVAYPFKIGKFEVTAAQYVEFLNAKAKSDPHALFNENFYMEGKIGCQIDRDGTVGNYSYSVSAEYANRPINWVSYWDACRFCNWLHNGQGDGDTETGAYTLNGYGGVPTQWEGIDIRRNPDAKWFVPIENEWYKAAYYDSNKPGGDGYWNYPTRSDSEPNRDFAGPNAANFYDGSYTDSAHYLTEVGAFVNSKSAYGTFDQGGNALEWNEAVTPPYFRGMRGGSFGGDAGRNVGAPVPQRNSQSAADVVGFRVAGALPRVAAGADSKPVYISTAPFGQGQFPRRPWPNPETGKPFFPLGWYEDYTYTTRPGQKAGTLELAFANLDIMAREGANMVLLGSAATELDRDDAQLKENLATMTAYLDHAHKRSIKVMIRCNWQEAFQDNNAAYIDRVRKYVESVSKHPALLGYQIGDEPEYYWVYDHGGMKQQDINARKAFIDGIAKLRNAIREWDGNKYHTVQTVCCEVPNRGHDSYSDWADFLPVLDTLQIDSYPIGITAPYFSPIALAMAWVTANGVAGIAETQNFNPAPMLQGVGSAKPHILWRDPLYDETRYMAYSSLTVGGWGMIHWIFNSTSENIRNNVASLHAELRQLIPALERSYEKPPFVVSHNHESITRNFYTRLVPDISTLSLEDEKNYYLIASDNTGVFEDVALRMKLPSIKDTKTREALVMNEDWSRKINYDSKTGEWVITTHKMCFGDINIWVIPKSAD